MSSIKIKIPNSIKVKWQEMLDDLASKANIPCATVTRIDYPEIEGYLTSNNSDNPAEAGDRSLLAGTYYERVINTDKEMLIPNALIVPEWDHNPDIEYGLIAYFGFPLHFASGKPFGTICILDTKENRFNKESRDLLLQNQKEIETDLAELGGG